MVWRQLSSRLLGKPVSAKQSLAARRIRCREDAVPPLRLLSKPRKLARYHARRSVLLLSLIASHPTHTPTASATEVAVSRAIQSYPLCSSSWAKFLSPDLTIRPPMRTWTKSGTM